MTDEPCCPVVCDLRPERTRFWAYHIKMALLNRYDPVESARSNGNPREDRHMGRGGICADGMRDELECIAVMNLLPEHYTLTDVNDVIRNADQYAVKLCPFAVTKRV